MPRRGGRHYVLVKGAEDAMEAFRLEIAKDLGLDDKIDIDGTFKQMTTEEVGQIGGEMVRRVQAAGEWAIKHRYEQGEQRLMPEDVLPDSKHVREMSNNGNITPHKSGTVHETPGSGQQGINTTEILQ